MAILPMVWGKAERQVMQPPTFQQLPPSEQQPIRKKALLAAVTPDIQYQARLLATRIPKLGPIGALELLAAIGRKANELERG